MQVPYGAEIPRLHLAFGGLGPHKNALIIWPEQGADRCDFGAGVGQLRKREPAFAEAGEPAVVHRIGERHQRPGLARRLPGACAKARQSRCRRSVADGESRQQRHIGRERFKGQIGERAVGHHNHLPRSAKRLLHRLQQHLIKLAALCVDARQRRSQRQRRPLLRQFLAILRDQHFDLLAWA